MKIYIIGGKAKCGKTTFSKFLKEELKNYGYKPCVMHLTQPLYGYAENYFEWNQHINEKPREFLQRMGIEVIKQKLGKKTFLLDRTNEDIEILSEFFDTFIIADGRLKDEFEYFKNNYHDVTAIKLERDDFDAGLSDTEKNHITEVDLDNYTNFDYTIKNSGILDLHEKAVEIAKITGAKNE